MRKMGIYRGGREHLFSKVRELQRELGSPEPVQGGGRSVEGMCAESDDELVFVDMSQVQLSKRQIKMRNMQSQSCLSRDEVSMSDSSVAVTEELDSDLAYASNSDAICSDENVASSYDSRNG